MLLYFAYGSNMSTSRLIRRVGDAGVLGSSQLIDYRHIFNKLGVDETAKGNIEADTAARVWGVLYRLNPEQVQALDRYESGYRRIDIEVARSGELVRAFTYTALRKRADLEPSAEYLAHYLRGAREHHLPELYLKEILPPWFDW